MNEEKTDGQFRVVDRRRFDERGDARNETNADDLKNPEPKAASSVKAATEKSTGPRAAASQAPRSDTGAPSESRWAEQSEDVDFSSFIISLATNVMFMLGEMPHPESGQTMLNLDAAKQSIDILGIIQDKTKGNLTEDEERLLTDVLTSLRMAYVSKRRG